MTALNVTYDVKPPVFELAQNSSHVHKKEPKNCNTHVLVSPRRTDQKQAIFRGKTPGHFEKLPSPSYA